MNSYPPGSRIAGRYEVASRPLMGGMGIVYLCYDHTDNRPVALKTFKPEYLPDRAARDRFLREADTWIKLERHPHIVHAYNVEPVGYGREVYLVLELIAKEQERRDASLRSWLMPGQPLQIEQAMLFAMQVIRGMMHAVNRIPGFVHRDLKPGNLLIGTDKLSNANINRLRVTDFGLASVVAVAREIAGTPLYMAPEQWQGELVSIATDIYALGAIMFEMLAGEHAVSGSSLLELEQAHKATQRKALPANVPIDLRAWVERCLRVAPSDRYASWGETEAKLEAVYATVTGKRFPEAETTGELGRTERIAAGWAQNAIGASYLDIGKAEVARGYFERVVDAGKKEGDKDLEGAALGNLGLAYKDLGEMERAIGYFEQHLTIAREIGDRRRKVVALGNLGVGYRELGDVRRAIGYYEQALAIAHELGDRQSEEAALGNLGIAYSDLGDQRRAIGNYEQVLAIARELGDRKGEGNSLANLGTAYYDLGEMQRAIEFYEQYLTIARGTGNRYGEGYVLGNLGNVYRYLGEMQRAIGYFEQALAISREIEDRRGEGNAIGNLGSTYADLREAGRAIGYFEQHLTIARELGDRHGEGNATGNLGTAYYSLGEVGRAIGFLEESLKIKREIGDKQGEALVSINTAHLFRALGDNTRALDLGRHALSLFQDIGSPYVQKAEQFVATFEGLAPTSGAGVNEAKLRQQFGQLIDAVVLAARGDKQARTAVEQVFPQLEEGRFRIVEPIKQIWQGERDERRLTYGLDETDSVIVREILEHLK